MTPKTLAILRLAVEQLKYNASAFALSVMKRLEISEKDIDSALEEIASENINKIT